MRENKRAVDSELVVLVVKYWIGQVIAILFVDCCLELCADLEHDAERSESDCVVVFWVSEVANRSTEKWRKD